MEIALFHVDAFTNRPFSGNAAAVCSLQGWLDDGTLRKVAAENNLSETAFLVPVGDHYDLRWFSPQREVRLCGHATLAAAYVVVHFLQPALQVVRFETLHAGPLLVRNDGDLLSMDFPGFVPRVCKILPTNLLPALGLGPRPSEVLEVNQTYFAVYKEENAIQDMRPDFSLLEQLHPYVVRRYSPRTRSRFCIALLQAELWNAGRSRDRIGPLRLGALLGVTVLGRAQLHARQLSERGGELWCEIAGNRVILKGNAVLIMQGSLEI